MEATPLLQNSCGKIYNDKIILSAGSKEYEVFSDSIFRLKTCIEITVRALIFILLPLGLSAFIYFTGGFTSSLHFIIILIAITSSLLTIWFTETRRYMLLITKDGRRRKIPLDKNKTEEAKRFITLFKKKFNQD